MNLNFNVDTWKFVGHKSCRGENSAFLVFHVTSHNNVMVSRREIITSSYYPTMFGAYMLVGVEIKRFYFVTWDCVTTLLRIISHDIKWPKNQKDTWRNDVMTGSPQPKPPLCQVWCLKVLWKWRFSLFCHMISSDHIIKHKKWQLRAPYTKPPIYQIKCFLVFWKWWWNASKLSCDIV